MHQGAARARCSLRQRELRGAGGSPAPSTASELRRRAGTEVADVVRLESRPSNLGQANPWGQDSSEVKLVSQSTDQGPDQQGPWPDVGSAETSTSTK